jgi:hypothetical protein
MSDYLSNLAARSLNLTAVIQPRLASLFEPPPETAGLFSERLELEPLAEVFPAEQTQLDPLKQPGAVPNPVESLQSLQAPNVLVARPQSLYVPQPTIEPQVYAEAPTQASVAPQVEHPQTWRSPATEPQVSGLSPLELPSPATTGFEQNSRQPTSLSPPTPISSAFESEAIPKQSATEPPGDVAKPVSGEGSVSMVWEQPATRTPGQASSDQQTLFSASKRDLTVTASSQSVEELIKPVSASGETPWNAIAPASTQKTVVAQPQVRPHVLLAVPIPMEPKTAPNPIRVTIGRIDLRATLPSPPPSQRAVRPAPKRSLDDYLRSRSVSGGESRHGGKG